MKTSSDKKRLLPIAAAVALLAALLMTAASLLLPYGGNGTSPKTESVQPDDQAETDGEAGGDREPESSRTMTRLKVAAQFMWADFKGWVSRQFSDEPPSGGDPLY